MTAIHLLAAKAHLDETRRSLMAALKEATPVESLLLMPLISEATDQHQRVDALILALEAHQ